MCPSVRPASCCKRLMRWRISFVLRSTRDRARAAPLCHSPSRSLGGFELDTHRREKGQRQHGQGDMPVPAAPGTDLVIRQASVSLTLPHLRARIGVLRRQNLVYSLFTNETKSDYSRDGANRSSFTLEWS